MILSLFYQYCDSAKWRQYHLIAWGYRFSSTTSRAGGERILFPRQSHSDNAPCEMHHVIVRVLPTRGLQLIARRTWQCTVTAPRDRGFVYNIYIYIYTCLTLLGCGLSSFVLHCHALPRVESWLGTQERWVFEETVEVPGWRGFTVGRFHFGIGGLRLGPPVVQRYRHCRSF